MTTAWTGTRPTRTPRSGERGAALFIVVLVIVLVSAIGLFAVRVSSLVQVAAGYARRATSAAYIAELATNVILADQSDDPSSYQKCLMVPTNTCVETAMAKAFVPVGTVVTCCAQENAKVLSVLAKNNSNLGALPLGQIARPDLPSGQAVLTNTRVEITEAYQNPVGDTGSPAGGAAVPVKIYQASYTVTGHLHPAFANGICSADSVRSSATSKVRAFVRYQAFE
jgi:hypothetical protein